MKVKGLASTKRKYLIRIIIAVFGAIISLIAAFKIKGTATFIDVFTGNMRPIIFVLLIILSIGLFLTAIGYLIGTTAGLIIAEHNQRKIIKDNNYDFLRELPNNYGIGICSLLLNSEIENHKDIVATILDLCAREYLSIRKESDKYCVVIRKDIDSNLLSNERYIMKLIKENDIKNIDYEEWYRMCVRDGVDKKLFTISLSKKESISSIAAPIKEKFEKFAKKFIYFLYIIGIIAIAIWEIITIKNTTIHNYEFWQKNVDFIFTSTFMIAFLGAGLGFVIVGSVYYFIVYPLLPFYLMIRTSYVNLTKTYLLKTDLGNQETYKLLAFKNFIKNFGAFSDKNPEEIEIWNEYLSFAHLFGLTEELIKTGYKDLITNSDISIDSFDDITLNNIEYLGNSN